MLKIMEERYKILVVDDEEDICEILKYNLESEGFSVDTVLSPQEALNRQLKRYDLFILDVMMKEMSGYRLADEIRNKRKIEIPIIFLTAKNSENEKLTGFSVGADDYITKPFSIREIIARVRAVIKRTGNPRQNAVEEPVKLSGIVLEPDKKRVFIDGVKKELTPIEYKILYLLVKNNTRVFTREEILNVIWKQTNVTDRTVDVHITRLRKKIGNYGKYLISRSGYGYCFELE